MSLKADAKKFRFWMLAALVAIAAGVAMLALFSNSSPHAPLPNPNGYDDFLKAASLLGGDPGSYETLGRDELRALVATNAEVLRVLRLGQLVFYLVQPTTLPNTRLRAAASMYEIEDE